MVYALMSVDPLKMRLKVADSDRSLKNDGTRWASGKANDLSCKAALLDGAQRETQER
jgi:hypothetical protein